jgi:hypothetical protein
VLAVDVEATEPQEQVKLVDGGVCVVCSLSSNLAHMLCLRVSTRGQAAVIVSRRGTRGTLILLFEFTG